MITKTEAAQVCFRDKSHRLDEDNKPRSQKSCRKVTANMTNQVKFSIFFTLGVILVLFTFQNLSKISGIDSSHINQHANSNLYLQLHHKSRKFNPKFIKLCQFFESPRAIINRD